MYPIYTYDTLTIHMDTCILWIRILHVSVCVSHAPAHDTHRIHMDTCILQRIRTRYMYPQRIPRLLACKALHQLKEFLLV